MRMACYFDVMNSYLLILASIVLTCTAQEPIFEVANVIRRTENWCADVDGFPSVTHDKMIFKVRSPIVNPDVPVDQEGHTQCVIGLNISMDTLPNNYRFTIIETTWTGHVKTENAGYIEYFHSAHWLHTSWDADYQEEHALRPFNDLPTFSIRPAFGGRGKKGQDMWGPYFFDRDFKISSTDVSIEQPSQLWSPCFNKEYRANSNTLVLESQLIINLQPDLSDEYDGQVVEMGGPDREPTTAEYKLVWEECDA